LCDASVEKERETKSKEEKSNVLTIVNARWLPQARSYPLCPESDRAGGRGAKLFTAAAASHKPVIPVVTFLTPLAESFSDLKDR